MDHRREINDDEIRQVTGGKVYLNESTNMCGFSAIGEKYPIKGNFDDLMELLFKELATHKTMGDAEFDKHMRNLYKSNGWI